MGWYNYTFFILSGGWFVIGKSPPMSCESVQAHAACEDTIDLIMQGLMVWFDEKERVADFGVQMMF